MSDEESKPEESKPVRRSEIYEALCRTEEATDYAARLRHWREHTLRLVTGAPFSDRRTEAFNAILDDYDRTEPDKRQKLIQHLLGEVFNAEFQELAFQCAWKVHAVFKQMGKDQVQP